MMNILHASEAHPAEMRLLCVAAVIHWDFGNWSILMFDFQQYYVFLFQAPPFVMKKSSGSSDNGTEEYEGLSIDMLEYMRQELGFRYKISLAPDGVFGNKDRLTGKWNGVIREIIDRVSRSAGQLFSILVG